MFSFSGAWPALVTPFTAEDKVNVVVLRELVEYLLDKRVGGFYVCGGTGEGLFMLPEERKLVTETVVDQVNGRVPVIAHIGSMVVSDAVELAEHAQEVGAAGISSVIPPMFQDGESLYTYFARVGAGAPDLPLLTYIFGGPMDAVALMRRLMEIPTVAGTKYTGPNMYEFREIVELRGDNWSIFSGMDEQCIYAAMQGACGNIGSTLNYMPGIYREVHNSYKKGDIAQGQELQVRANQVTRVLFSFGFFGALKEVMRMLGFDCGKPRLPHLPFAEEKRNDLRAQLEAIDFFTVAEM
jgi:N-acetylneuraminate lyase